MQSPQAQPLRQWPSRRERLAGCVANELRADLEEMRADIDARFGSASQRLWAAFERFPNTIVVSSFEGTDADSAFRVNHRDARIEFNSMPFIGVRMEINARIDNKNDRRAFARSAIRGCVLHELYHFGPQNLVTHADARAIARVASPFQLAIMDLNADVFAAKCAATIECGRRNNQSEFFYLWNMLQQLELGLNFWVPQVKAPSTKPHKQMRFFGHALMAARLADAVPDFRLPGDEVPFDTPLFPLIDSENGALIVLAMLPEPITWIPSVGVNVASLRKLLDGLETRPAAETIEITRRLLHSLGKLKPAAY